MIMGEASKAIPIEIYGKWVVRDAESVDAHVELPTSEEERVEDVSLTDVIFSSDVLVGTLPLADIADLVEDEDPLALALRGGLHYPQHLFAILPLELFVEDDVFARHQEGRWQEVVRVGLSSVAFFITEIPCFSSARLYFLRFLLSMSFLHSSFQPRKWLTLAPA